MSRKRVSHPVLLMDSLLSVGIKGFRVLLFCFFKKEKTTENG